MILTGLLWSSAYMALFTKSFMNTIKRVGDKTPLCGTPRRRSIFLLLLLSMTTLALLLCVYDLIHLNVFPEILHILSFSRSPSVHTLSNAFCKSVNTKSVFFYVEIHLLFPVPTMWFDILYIDVL